MNINRVEVMAKMNLPHSTGLASLFMSQIILYMIFIFIYPTIFMIIMSSSVSKAQLFVTVIVQLIKQCVTIGVGLTLPYFD